MNLFIRKPFVNQLSIIGAVRKETIKYKLFVWHKLQIRSTQTTIYDVSYNGCNSKNSRNLSNLFRFFAVKS